MSIVTKEGITVRVGQLWKDLDKRMEHRGPGTVVAVDAVAGKASLQFGYWPTLTKISIRRMHKHSTGWTMVEDVLQEQGGN